MQILISFFLIIFFTKISDCFNSSSSFCLPCSSHLCYQCYNTLPNDRIHIEKLSIQCNQINNLFQKQEHFYSMIQSYTIMNCTMKILYLNQYIHWNYLEYMSINYANLTYLSMKVFNRSLPILYSIKTLNLSYNSIRKLNKNFSSYFPSLEKLDLSYNQLEYLKKKIFKNFIYLKELYLNNNYFKHILTNIFPSQSLYLINLNNNSWHCTCTNVLILSISRPIPICSTPKQFENQNASSIARQCFLRTKANILITINTLKQSNLTCVLSSIIDEWKNKINKNLTLISAWHIEQRRSISLEYLFNLSYKSDKHLICFNFNSTYPELIDTIITLPTPIFQSTITTILSSTTRIHVISSTKLNPFFLWILNISKTILPKYFQKSDKSVLITWLILLILALIILILLIYYVHSHKTHSFIHFHTNPRTLFHMKLTCQNHKCLCQYRRRVHSKLYLTNSTSSNILENQSLYIQPSFIEPNQLRYAKIKRISSTKTFQQDYLTGEFRTIIKFKSLPN